MLPIQLHRNSNRFVKDGSPAFLCSNIFLWFMARCSSGSLTWDHWHQKGNRWILQIKLWIKIFTLLLQCTDGDTKVYMKLCFPLQWIELAPWKSIVLGQANDRGSVEGCQGSTKILQLNHHLMLHLTNMLAPCLDCEVESEEKFMVKVLTAKCIHCRAKGVERLIQLLNIWQNLTTLL